MLYSHNMFLIVIIVMLTLPSTRLCWTVSATEVSADKNPTSKDNLSTEEISSNLRAGRLSHVATEDEDALTSSTALSGNMERRRSKNFRGDLGKRSWNGIANSALSRADAVNTPRRGSRGGTNRLRPDLGKRSMPPYGDSASGINRQSSIDSKMSSVRRRFRPDLGKRAHFTDDEHMNEDTYFRWPLNSDAGGEEQFSIDKDDSCDDGSNAMNLFDGRPNSYDQQVFGYADENSDVVDPSSMERSSRGRSGSFRGDLGKRRAKSSFRGDLGKRSVRRRRSLNAQTADLPQTATNQLSVDIEDDIRAMAGRESIENTGELVKRGRTNGKSSFRGDLGKRGNRLAESKTMAVGDFISGLEGDADDFYSSSSSARLDKRPRSSSFRGDLGKRQESDLVGDETADEGKLEARPSLVSFSKRPRSQSFRGDLGK